MYIIIIWKFTLFFVYWKEILANSHFQWIYCTVRQRCVISFCLSFRKNRIYDSNYILISGNCKNLFSATGKVYQSLMFSQIYNCNQGLHRGQWNNSKYWYCTNRGWSTSIQNSKQNHYNDYKIFLFMKTCH